MTNEGELLNREEWEKMVLRLRNHPSLMVYCMGNEIDEPGRNPFCRELYDLTHTLDPNRFFLDTCSRGEFDREAVDLDVQHMGYYFPFGHSYDMFENTQNLLHIGSCKDLKVIEPEDQENSNWRIARRIPAPRPIVAHEVCHYVGLRDLHALEEKFSRYQIQPPWWLAELRKLVRQKGHEKNYSQLCEASRRFQFLSWKLTLEAIRRSPLLSGFHMLQLADTEHYENSNGLLDCFDEPKGFDKEAFLKFNSDCILVADLPRRTYFEKELVNIPIKLSHYCASIGGKADFSFELRVGKGRLLISGFNFTGLRQGQPETCGLFESLIRYFVSDDFQPQAEIAPETLSRYLLQKGEGPIVKERRMTQFWQLDATPLETKKYWRESIEYLDDKPINPDAQSK